jgi:hypothetical protein
MPSIKKMMMIMAGGPAAFSKLSLNTAAIFRYECSSNKLLKLKTIAM